LATIEQFLGLDVRVGTVVAAEVLRGAPKPTYVLSIELGELGRRQATAEITDMYDADDLVGLQVVAVVNLPPRRVATLAADALVLTVGDGRGENVLLIPERPVPDGGRVA
jgi:tRNA-binding protein